MPKDTSEYNGRCFVKPVNTVITATSVTFQNMGINLILKSRSPNVLA